MAGEIIKTKGIVLAIHPWSRTSHVVAWLTPDHGCVSTLVKGAVRPKSAFLGQYDLFYACDLLYYAHASGGDLHALREVVPANLREPLRGRWRETALAGYGAALVRELAPPGGEASAWYAAFDRFLDALVPVDTPSANIENADESRARRFTALIQLEMQFLRLGGFAPDLTRPPASAATTDAWTPFALDHGRFGEGTRTVRLSRDAVQALLRPDARTVSLKAKEDAVRFLGVFLAYHLDTPPNLRRTVVQMLSR